MIEYCTKTMYSRWSNVAVVILWLSAMGWLMAEKVLPPLLIGEPPKSLSALILVMLERLIDVPGSDAAIRSPVWEWFV